MQFLDLVLLLPRRARIKDGDWKAQCVGHDDGESRENFSLHLTRGSESALLRCFAGCPNERILEALNRLHGLDLTMRDLYYTTPWPRLLALGNGAGADSGHTSPAPPPESRVPEKREIVATYDYVDPAGAVLYQAVRYKPKDFRQRRPNGAGGWIWDLEGIARVVYRQPDLVEQPRVFWCEGEKDADRLAALGLPATTACGGSNAWRDEYAVHLERLGAREVIILPDHDEPGERYAAAVARGCRARGLAVRIIRLPGLAPKGDISDWLDAGHTAAELEQLAAQAPQVADEMISGPEPAITVTAAARASSERTLHLLSWAEMIREPVPPIVYQWEGWTPQSSVALISGAGESLKSWLALYLAVSIAAGRPALADPSTAAPNLAAGPVLYITAENSIDEEKRRCAMLKVGLELPDELPITFVAAEGLCLGQEADFAGIVELVGQIRPVAIFIDSAIAVSGITQENDNSEVRAFMRTRILPLARVHGATVYVIVHSPKPPIQRGALFTDEHVTRGASDWRNAADAVLYLRRELSLGDQAVVIRHTKSRIGRRHPSIWFSLDDIEAGQAVRLAFGGSYDETSGQGETAALAKALRATIEVLKTHPAGIYLKDLGPQVVAAGIAPATARWAGNIIRGKAPWFYGPRRGQKHAVVTEDSHGRRVFLTFDPAQSPSDEVPDDE